MNPPPSDVSIAPANIFLEAFRGSPALQSVIRADDARLIEVNDTFLTKLGFARDEVIGKKAPELNFWVDPDMLPAYSAELAAKGFIRGREVRLRGPNGDLLVVLLSTQIVTIAGDGYFVSAGVDITERKEAEARLREGERRLRESEARASALYQSISAAVVVFDDTGFLQANQAAITLFGVRSLEEFIGKTLRDFSPATQPDGEASAAASERLSARAGTAGRINFEWMALKADGSPISLEVTLTPLQLDNRDVLQAVITDLTHRKNAETELQRALEKERELNQLKTDFVSLVSHEFRTPLEVIMSSTDNLDRYHERLPVAKRQSLLQTIHKSVRHMAAMMEEVLLLGRMEAKRMEFNPIRFDLDTFCRRICDEMESATNARCPLALTIAHPGTRAMGDESIIRHIVTNLIGNAVKYSPEGATVDIQVAREGADAVFRIVDRGCGIPAADRARLFEAFHRASNVRHIPGTGLGLVIVQRCLALHGGRIAVESTEGAGSTFTARLPLFPPTP